MQQKATKAELQHVYSSLQVQQQEAKADVQHLQVEQKETRAEVQHVYRSLAKSIEVHCKPGTWTGKYKVGTERPVVRH